MIKMAIHGAAGRMGLRLVALTLEDPLFELVAAIDQPDHPSLGADVGLLAGMEPTGVLLGRETGSGADVMLDFSVPAAARAALETCVSSGTRMVIGTTGLGPEDHQLIDEAAQSIAVLQAPNMSLGVNLLFALAGQAAKQLGDDYDIEIVETHHRYKQDAPSGTALGLAKAICEATDKDLNEVVVHGRQGNNVPRQPRQIGIHALRSGDIVGRHTVSFGTLGEELQLTHVATTRDVFAHGALTAAKWLADKKAGRYHMANVLGV